MDEVPAFSHLLCVALLPHVFSHLVERPAENRDDKRAEDHHEHVVGNDEVDDPPCAHAVFQRIFLWLSAEPVCHGVACLEYGKEEGSEVI